MDPIMAPSMTITISATQNVIADINIMDHLHEEGHLTAEADRHTAEATRHTAGVDHHTAEVDHHTAEATHHIVGVHHPIAETRPTLGIHHSNAIIPYIMDQVVDLLHHIDHHIQLIPGFIQQGDQDLLEVGHPKDLLMGPHINLV